jgi:hypothetical protein
MPITRVLRKFNINVSFQTNNSLENCLKRKNLFSGSNEKYNRCGIYKMKYESFSKVYIGRTGRSFKVQFKGHMSDIVHNREKTGYSHHVLNSGHETAHNHTNGNFGDSL